MNTTKLPIKYKIIKIGMFLIVTVVIRIIYSTVIVLSSRQEKAFTTNDIGLAINKLDEQYAQAINYETNIISICESTHGRKEASIECEEHYNKIKMTKETIVGLKTMYETNNGEKIYWSSVASSHSKVIEGLRELNNSQEVLKYMKEYYLEKKNK